MAGRPDQEFYDALVQLYAPPSSAERAPEAALERWRGRLPDLLLRWWSEHGWGGLSQGKYWICDPDKLRPVIEEVFTGDPEFHPDDLIPFGYNALGVINVYFGENRTMTIDLPFGTVTWRQQFATSRGVPISELQLLYGDISSGATGPGWNDENGLPIFPWARESLGELASGEIYGFVPAYSMGQRYPVENLQKVPLVEHLVFLASLQRPTLYDYERPDGAQGGFGTLVPRRPVGPQE